MSATDSVVAAPRLKWVQTHRLASAALAVVLVAGLAYGGYQLFSWLTAPVLPCGSGMAANADDTECIGVDLDSGPLARNEPAEMTALEGDVKAANDLTDTQGQPTQDYVSLVLLLDLSPVAGIDTRSYPDIYPAIEGTLTAAWRANHTAAFGRLPKVKIFLGNMGSQYAGWSQAVDQIKANTPANHITAVIGLGQSVDATRAAAEKIVDGAPQMPVIGSTVTGDTMNFDPGTNVRNKGFFRVAPTNSDTATAAAAYIAGIEPDPTKVAIVQDNAAGDDYNLTLAKAADQDLPKAHQFPFTSPTTMPPGLQRDQELIQQFDFLDQNVCAVAPNVIYFAGRGADLGAFVEKWTETGTQCAARKVVVVTGDDGTTAVNSADVQHAVQGGLVQVVYTSEASYDEWGACPATTGVKDLYNLQQADYDTFQAAFTGLPTKCGHQRVLADDGAPPLSFPASDLRSEEAAGNHDAAAVAIIAARNSDHGVDNGDGGIVVRDPSGQVGIIEEIQCTTAVAGASGMIQFSAQDPAEYGNPVDKPVPITRINGDGTTTTLYLANSGRGVAPASC